MRIPRTPSTLSDLVNDPDRMKSALTSMGDEKFSEFVREVNDRYLHWDKLRFRVRPMNIDPQAAWDAVVLTRFPQFQELPLSFLELTKHLRYWNPPRHEEWLHRIDKMSADRVDGVPGKYGLPNDDNHYLFNSLMEEAIASSQLEGASTTREIAKRMLRENRAPKNTAERMIINNYSAIQEIRDLRNDHLTPEMLCAIQGILTKDTLENESAVGRFRSSDEKICIEDVRTGEILFTPPDADTIDFRIKQICDFANTTSDPFVHPVIKAIALHFMIGFVHPFIDGNGRTARAMFYWYMLKKGYWYFEYLPISRIFIRAPVKYARAYLYTETDRGDLNYFIHYHLRVIHTAMLEFKNYANRKRAELREATAIVKSHPELNHRQMSILCDALNNNGAYTIREHQRAHRVTYPTARGDLLQLCKLGLLTRSQEGRQTWFYASEHLQRKLFKHRKQESPIESIPEKPSIIRTSAIESDVPIEIPVKSRVQKVLNFGDQQDSPG